MVRKSLLSRRRSSCRLAQFLDEAGDGVARLRAFADPVLGAVEFDREIFALFERIVSADLLDELAIAGTAAIGHDNAECRRVFRADPFHANFYRHKFFKRTRRIAVAICFASLDFKMDGKGKWRLNSHCTKKNHEQRNQMQLPALW